MGRLFVLISTGPENATRAAMGLLVARAALTAGHDVDLFFGGDAVGLLRPATLDAGMGIGTGSMREHVDALVAGGATFRASGLSSKARGLGPDQVGDLPVQFVMPDVIAKLTFEADRVLTF